MSNKTLKTISKTTCKEVISNITEEEILDNLILDPKCKVTSTKVKCPKIWVLLV